jgi:Protein of unknown function (DUF1236)
MKSITIAITAAILVAGSSIALAQGMQGGGGMQPSGGGGMRSGGAIPGGGGPGGGGPGGGGGAMRGPGQGIQGGPVGRGPGERNAVEPRGSNMRGAQGQTRRSETPGERGSNARGAQAPERGQGAVRRAPTTGQAQRETQTRAPQTTGQGPSSRTTTNTNVTNTNVNVSLNAQQRARIHDVVLAQRNIPRLSNIDIDIRVGAFVPRTVELAVVPEAVVRIFPRFRRHRVFIFNDEVVIVDPATFRIVAVLPA